MIYLVRIDGADTVDGGSLCESLRLQRGKRAWWWICAFTDPKGLTDCVPKAQEEQIIYELHIKDFSYDRDRRVPEAYREEI